MIRLKSYSHAKTRKKCIIIFYPDKQLQSQTTANEAGTLKLSLHSCRFFPCFELLTLTSGKVHCYSAAFQPFLEWGRGEWPASLLVFRLFNITQTQLFCCLIFYPYLPCCRIKFQSNNIFDPYDNSFPYTQSISFGELWIFIPFYIYFSTF